MGYQDDSYKTASIRYDLWSVPAEHGGGGAMTTIIAEATAAVLDPAPVVR